MAKRSLRRSLRFAKMPIFCVPFGLLLRIVPRLQREFPNAGSKLYADAGIAAPLVYEFRSSFSIQFLFGIATNSRRKKSAAHPALTHLILDTGSTQLSGDASTLDCLCWRISEPGYSSSNGRTSVP
jgi:hypothetical protein